MSKTVYMATPTFPIRSDGFDMFSAQLEADRFMTLQEYLKISDLFQQIRSTQKLLSSQYYEA